MNKIDYIIILFDRKYFVTNITMECGQNMFDNESKCLEYFGVTEFWSIERKKTQKELVIVALIGINFLYAEARRSMDNSD